MSYRDAHNTVVLGLKVNSEEISASLRFLHELCTTSGVPPLAPAPSPKPAVAWVELTHSHQLAQVILQLPNALSPVCCNVCVPGSPRMGLGVRDGSSRPQEMEVGENECSSALASSPALENPSLHLFKKQFLALTLCCSLQCKDGRNKPLQINDLALWWTTLPFPMWRCSKGLKGLEHIEVGNEDWLFQCHRSCLC